MHRIARPTLPLLAALVLVLGLATGCKSGASECRTHVDCPEGQYCGTEGLCTLDCRQDSDCASGKCTSLGQCFGATGDGGTPDTSLLDQGPRPDGADAGPDQGVDQTIYSDLFPWPDARPDQYVFVPDMPRDSAVPFDGEMGIADMPLNPDMMVPSSMQKVAAGTFSMGSASTELCHQANEDQHSVTLSRAVLVANTEVTRDEFKTVMGYDPSKASPCTGRCPADSVSWHEAATYCNALSASAGLAQCYTCSGTPKICSLVSSYAGTSAGSTIYDCPGYRLPTEAEWERAARGNTATHLYSGDLTVCTGRNINADKVGWYTDNASQTAHPVGLKSPNAFGLFDTSGNVMEWTNDWYLEHLGTSAVTDPLGATSGTSRVLKGGSWNYAVSTLRPAYRTKAAPTLKFNAIGFRCVRTSP